MFKCSIFILQAKQRERWEKCWWPSQLKHGWIVNTRFNFLTVTINCQAPSKHDILLIFSLTSRKKNTFLLAKLLNRALNTLSYHRTIEAHIEGGRNCNFGAKSAAILLGWTKDKKILESFLKFQHTYQVDFHTLNANIDIDQFYIDHLPKSRQDYSRQKDTYCGFPETKSLWTRRNQNGIARIPAEWISWNSLNISEYSVLCN